jgi:hypothetical protein
MSVHLYTNPQFICCEIIPDKSDQRKRPDGIFGRYNDRLSWRGMSDPHYLIGMKTPLIVSGCLKPGHVQSGLTIKFREALE